MAGGKETPRQKMIGLMYLVLMAMLAMNVSKEIINAFITIDEKMQSGNTLTREGIRKQYSDVSNALIELNSVDSTPKELIEKQQKLKNSLDEIIAMSKEAENFMVQQASDMIIESNAGAHDEAKLLGHYENLEAGTYYYIEDEYFHLASMSHLSKKDDYDTPTRLFVGDDHKNISEKGLAIRSTVEEYRDALLEKICNYDDLYKGQPKTWKFTKPSMELKTTKTEDVDAFNASLDEALKTINPNDVDKVRQIYQILTYPQEVDNHGVTYPWQAGLFDHSPVVAAGAMFTSLKGDIERAEAIAVNLVASKSEKPKFNFNKIKPLAFSDKGYINSGDSLGLSVMIAAYDSTQDLKLEYWLDDSTRTGDPLIFEGEPGQRLGLGKGASPGKHYVYGNIEVEENGATKKKDWEFDYTVGSPTGTVANSEMNVLYMGYDNKIEASGSGYPTIKASCSGCSMSGGSNGQYIATVKGGKTATITVTGIDDAGNSTQIAKKEFRIKRLPKPTPVFVGYGVDASTIKLGKLKQAKKLNAELKGSPINLPFNITSFKMTVIQNGEAVTVKSSGAKLSGKMLNMVKKMKAGQKLYIEDVYAKSAKGGKADKIPGLILKVVR